MTDEEQQQQQKVLRKKIVRTQDYYQTFTTEFGHRVLLDLMAHHFVLHSCFSSDPLEMARREGERNVVIRIMQALKADPEALSKLLREADTYAQI